MLIRPANHYGDANRPEIAVVDQTDDPGLVCLLLGAATAETFDDRDIERLLTPSEARELAAMLWHHADRADHAIGYR